MSPSPDDAAVRAGAALVATPAAALEAVAALGWRGLETTTLGGWLLRAAGGFTGRANSVLPLADPGLPLDAALARVGSWYDERGLAARFQVPLPLAAGLDAALDARGWVARDRTKVLVSPLGPLVAVGAGVVVGEGQPGDVAATVDDEPDAAWVAEYHYRGGGLPPHAREVLVNADVLGFASLRDPRDGTVLAIARGSVDPADDGTRWLGVTAVEVVEGARRRGLGSRILRELARWADDRGATACYLQVAAENSAALALYGGAGFVEHHEYQYRHAPT